MRSLTFFLLLALAGLQYKLWLGDGGIYALRKVEHELEEQEQTNNQLAARNRALHADILELKSGDQALEEQARHELGMVKQGEVYYQFVD